MKNPPSELKRGAKIRPALEKPQHWGASIALRFYIRRGCVRKTASSAPKSALRPTAFGRRAASSFSNYAA